MLNFVGLVLAVTLGILLASVISVFIVLQPKVMNLYMKYTMKTIQKYYEDEDLD